MSTLSDLTFKQKFERVFYSFPVQLLIMQIKKGHLLLFFWAILFGFISNTLANKYGVPYLFLAPEYLNQVNFWSFLIIGISCGMFIMTYNIASYTSNASHFPFIATLNRPFLKYSGNNLIIPLVFVILYIYYIFLFYKDGNELNFDQLMLCISGLVSGIFMFLFFNYIYFFSTNKNLFSLFKITKNDSRKKKRDPHELKIKRKWWQFQAPLEIQEEWRIETYFTGPFQIRLARDIEHYPPEVILKVFNQNHLNATRFQIGVFITLIVIGSFREVPFFQIPAGASIFLIMTIFLIFTASLKSWLRGWSSVVLFTIIIFVDQLSKHNEFGFSNFAYGMNYWGQKAEFNDKTIKEFKDNTENFKNDFNQNVYVLNKWRLNNSKNSFVTKKKPKLVIINTSGGGLRSALWTFYSLSKVDSLLNGELLRHTQMITGSSGGMLGAAYLRELYFKSRNDSSINLYKKDYFENLGKDILNPVAFTIAINDIFIRYQRFQDGQYSYIKDRGYIFERQFNFNCDTIFTNRRLKDYIAPVSEGIIPEMIFAPVITNDGRRIIISSQPTSYLTNNIPLSNVKNKPIVESIEFRRFFKNQDADNILLTSIMRMNATFPYIMPSVTLPSNPPIDVMDAGLRDNFGMITTIKYLYTFRNWLSTNTSGVVIIEVRDKFKEEKIVGKKTPSKLESLITPIGSVYGNLTTIQTYNQDDLLQYASLWFDGKIDIVPFQLKNNPDEKISLSWHLTEKEKKQIYNAMTLDENIKSAQKLKKLLE